MYQTILYNPIVNKHTLAITERKISLAAKRVYLQFKELLERAIFLTPEVKENCEKLLAEAKVNFRI